MKNAEQLLFDLVRTAIGTQPSAALSQQDADQAVWREVFGLAQKQSLVGICYAAVQKLGIPFSQELADEWEELSAAILLRNAILDRQCVSVQKKLSAKGFRSCILKGQGLAPYYEGAASGLASCRQSGDIDVWVKGDGGVADTRRRLLAIARKADPGCELLYHHVGAYVFPDTEVEFHVYPSWMFSPLGNRRLQAWMDAMAEAQFSNTTSLPEGDGEITAPGADFNLVYLLVHIYRHIWSEGIGLRQMLDYCLVLKGHDHSLDAAAMRTIRSLGMGRFAAAVMWVLQHAFALPDGDLLCAPDRQEGEFLLGEIMMAGNFGIYDQRSTAKKGESSLHKFVRRSARNFGFVRHYPSESLWSPVFKIWHYVWRMAWR